MSKSREELIAQYQTDNFELFSLEINVEGFDQGLKFSQDMENMPQELFFSIPEYSTYTVTIQYRVKNTPIKKLNYYEVVKKGGIPLKTRKQFVADEAQPTEEYQTVTFPPDKIPGGMLLRGTYPATSTFYQDGKEIITCPFSLAIVKKGVTPSIRE